jgi:hypothetical protein
MENVSGIFWFSSWLIVEKLWITGGKIVDYQIKKGGRYVLPPLV